MAVRLLQLQCRRNVQAVPASGFCSWIFSNLGKSSYALWKTAACFAGVVLRKDAVSLTACLGATQRSAQWVVAQTLPGAICGKLV